MSRRKAALPEDFSDRVYALVRTVPAGRVVSYGGIAALLGHPRAARGVGHALSALPDDVEDVPWWRVINARGAISLPGAGLLEADAERAAGGGAGHRARSALAAPWAAGALQRRLLEDEGVEFGRSGRVDWDRFGWGGPAGEDRS